MEPLGPTAVTVGSFRAIATARGALIRWRTGSEAQLAGFNLYRSSRGGELIRLNRALIRALSAGRPQGHSYTYADRGARGAVAYRLELVRLDGSKVWFGTTTPRV
jgi:hypothetical protein